VRERTGLTDGRLALLLCTAAVAVGAYLGIAHRSGPVAAEARPVLTGPTPVAQPSTIQVHVAGWVVSPGVVSLPEGALVADAIRAAGGLRPGARSDALNLAAAVADGNQIVVPGPDQAPAGNGAETPGGGGGGGLISLNRATAAELEGLPGVGPVLAGRIVAHRDQNGPFSAVEDLLEVPGIGEAKLAAIRDLVTVP
jgi:competence protein ComEA